MPVLADFSIRRVEFYTDRIPAKLSGYQPGSSASIEYIQNGGR